MVVRGEDCEAHPVPTRTSPGAVVDRSRRFPCGFEEFGPEWMSSLADACRKAGLADLFLTCMKIYPKKK